MLSLLRKLQNFYQAQCKLLYTKHSFSLILTMVMSYTIKLLITHLKKKLKPIQYNTCLPLKGAIRGASKEKIYQKLRLESLGDQHWYRKLCLFIRSWKIKILNIFSALFLPDPCYTWLDMYITSPHLNIEHNIFKNYFFHRPKLNGAT